MTCNLKTVSLSLILTLSSISLSFAKCPLNVSGDFSQGGVVYGSSLKGYDVYYNDKKVPVTSDNKFIIGIGRDQGEKASLKAVKKGTKESKDCSFDVSKTNWKIDRINGVEQEKVTPKKEFTDRIIRESNLIKEARKVFSNNEFPTYFIMPVDGRISGVFGSQRIFNGTPKAYHSGTDIAAKTGTPIKSVADGTVVLAEHDNFFNGNIVIIDHGNYVNSTYAHLSKIDVKVGDKIKQGDVIGKVGTTGRSTGPHLHITININGNNIDPLRIIKKEDKKTLK